MKISTKGRYALRMVIDLAEHADDGFISLKDIAARQGISKKYLEQLVPLRIYYCTQTGTEGPGI